MPNYKKYFPENEKDLHHLIEMDIENLEEGLAIVQREYPTDAGVLDFLCVDSGGRIVIIEVKLNQDDNMLFQALRYFVQIDRLRYQIAQSVTDFIIDPQEAPRIILVASDFSENLKTFASLVLPDVELFRYTAIKDSNNRGVVFDSVALTSIGSTTTPSEPPSIEKLMDYITKDTLHPKFNEARGYINNLSNDIEEYATTGYVGYKYKGRQFAWIRPFRRAYEVGAHIINDDKQLLDYQRIRLETGNEDYSEIFENIKISFLALGGRLREK